MIEIYKHNIYSIIGKGISESVLLLLEKELTVAHPNYWFSPKYKQGLWDGKTHFLRMNTMSFPTGLLFIVEEKLHALGEEYHINDMRHKHQIIPQLPVELKGITLRPYQQQAIKEAIRATRGVLELPTGSGKTEIIIGIVSALKWLKTLIVVNTKDLLHQTAERFANRRPEISVSLWGDNHQDSSGQVVVATVQSVSRMFEQADYKDFINEFSVLIYDECHHSSATTWNKIGFTAKRAYYRFGTSGTALRRDVLNNMKIMAVTGPAIFTVKAAELIEQGYLSDIKIQIVENPEVIREDHYQSVYKKAIVESIIRNNLIIHHAAEHYRRNKRVMILVRQIDHGIRLQQMLGERHIPSEFVFGDNSSSERIVVKKQFEHEGNFVLIASPIFDEGVDLPSVDVLIIASGGQSEWKTIQKVGRGLRKKQSTNQPLLVIDFRDRSRFLDRHSAQRISIYEKENFLRR